MVAVVCSVKSRTGSIVLRGSDAECLTLLRRHRLLIMQAMRGFEQTPPVPDAVENTGTDRGTMVSYV
jgi:hypothetical protein